MSNKTKFPHTEEIVIEDTSFRQYPFICFKNILDGKSGSLHIQGNDRGKQHIEIQRLGFGFPENPEGPIRLFDRRNASKIILQFNPSFATFSSEEEKHPHTILCDTEEDSSTTKYYIHVLEMAATKYLSFKRKYVITFTPDAE